MEGITCPYCGHELMLGLPHVPEGQEYPTMDCPHVYVRAEENLDEVELLKHFVKTEWSNGPTNISRTAGGVPPDEGWIERHTDRLLPIIRQWFSCQGGWWLVKNHLQDREAAAQHLGLEIQRLRAGGQ